MDIFKRVKESSNVLKRIIIFLSCVSLVVGAACVLFYRQVQQSSQKESEHYLKEIADRTTSNVNRIINDNFAALKTMKSVIENNKPEHFKVISKFLKEQVNTWEFTDIILIDANGIAYDLEGKEVSITGDSFLRNMSLDVETIAPTQIINNEEKTVFSSPLKDVELNGQKFVALASVYEPDQFDKILSMNAFDEQSYAIVINESGNVVIRSASQKANIFGYNIVQTLHDNDASAKKAIQQLQSDLKHHRSGQLKATLKNEEQYLVYTPINMRDWYLLSFFPISVVNANSNLLLQSTLLMTGLVFLVFTMFLVVIIVSFTGHNRKLEQIAYVDVLTEGHTIQYFYTMLKELLNDNEAKYALLFTNVQRFKVLNDQFGRETCDDILRCIYNGIEKDLREGETLARSGADNFVCLITYENSDDILQRLVTWDTNSKHEGVRILGTLPMYTQEYGIYLIDELSISADDMIDRARLALRNTNSTHKENDYIQYAFYNEKVRHQLISEKHLEDMMEKALANEEFQVYLQPKYLTGKCQIGGAEALVRWCSVEEGMIYPNDFIPLFEKNGFIIKLDHWVFDKVCQLLQSWHERGIPLLRISINCSRAHLKDQNFLDEYVKIFKKYTFPASCLELEFTENMVLEETQRLIKVIEEIHEIGFECSMDDFGSGYSSLNLLQDIHVDTLKLDRIFFKNALEEGNRTKAIVSCILHMAQSLKMETVAEGIEEWNQVLVLDDLGCNYIQGYVYAKAMPIHEFEEIYFNQLQNEEVDQNEKPQNKQ